MTTLSSTVSSPCLSSGQTTLSPAPAAASQFDFASAAAAASEHASSSTAMLTGVQLNGQPTNQLTPCYHAVRGKDRWGLLIDPGAADAVCGTQTLLEYCQQVLWPQGISHVPQGVGQTSFTGIDGLPLRSGLRTRIPVDLGPFKTHYECDTIGASGDRCPMLLPNRSLIRKKACMLFGYYDNDDGLLILPHPVTHIRFALRLLLTDSGHYLLPIDGTQTDDSLSQRRLAAKIEGRMQAMLASSDVSFARTDGAVSESIAAQSAAHHATHAASYSIHAS